MEQLSFNEINRVDLVDYLMAIGIPPKKRKGYRYFYVSPIAAHPQHRPTFIVSRSNNRWRETISKEHGNLTDLAVRLFACTIGELPAILQATLPAKQPGQPAPPVDPIRIEAIHPIRSPHLERLLWQHRIPLHVARRYYREIWYKRENLLFSGMGWSGEEVGSEIFLSRDQHSLLPAHPTLFINSANNTDPSQFSSSHSQSNIAPGQFSSSHNQSNTAPGRSTKCHSQPNIIPVQFSSSHSQSKIAPIGLTRSAIPSPALSPAIAIFREPFDLLSFVALFSGPTPRLPDLLALNTIIPFPAIRHMLTPYRHIHLFLPNDAAGIAFSTLATVAHPNALDHRRLYQGYACLNDWVCHIGTAPSPIFAPSAPSQ